MGGGGYGTGGYAPGCGSVCHGAPESPAPPPDTTGQTATDAPGVGAHQAHLGASSWRGPIACRECHLIPRMAGPDPCVPTHYNGGSDLDWGPLARFGYYDPGALSCSGTYCHGGTLLPDPVGESTNRVPEWVVVDGSQAACGEACHALPPGETHSEDSDCESCHGEVIASFNADDPAASVWADADLHIDGIAQSDEGGAAGTGGSGGAGGSAGGAGGAAAGAGGNG